MGLLFHAIRFALFRLPSEEAHALALRAAGAASRRRWVRNLIAWAYATEEPLLRTRCMGCDFPTPIGLAAGFDPDAVAVPLLAALGFGHLEIGGVTPRPSLGRKAPRLGRIPDGAGLWYEPGQPSRGPEIATRNLGRIYPGVPVGANLIGRGPLAGEGPDVMIDEVAETARVLAPIASHITLNSTVPGLPIGGFDDPGRLAAAVARILDRVEPPCPPVLVKLPHGLPPERMDGLAASAVGAGAAGLVLGGGAPEKDGRVSCGPALLEQTLSAVRRARRRLGPTAVLIACGGITSGSDALRAVGAGADLVQILSALVYRGPGAPGLIAREMAREMRKRGARTLTSLRDAEVG